MDLTGLQWRCHQDEVPFVGSRGGTVLLPFLASSGCLCLSAHGPLSPFSKPVAAQEVFLMMPPLWFWCLCLLHLHLRVLWLHWATGCSRITSLSEIQRISNLILSAILIPPCHVIDHTHRVQFLPGPWRRFSPAMDRRCLGEVIGQSRWKKLQKHSCHSATWLALTYMAVLPSIHISCWKYINHSDTTTENQYVAVAIKKTKQTCIKYLNDNLKATCYQYSK